MSIETLLLVAAITNVTTAVINLGAAVLKIYADNEKTPRGGNRKRSTRKKRR